MSISVFLADDHALLREGLKVLLEMQPDLEVIGEASDGLETVRQVTRLKPSVALLDIGMPELNGIEATRQIRESCPGTRIVILSMHSSANHIARAFKAGARGYLLKDTVGAEVARAVRAVHAGRRYLSQKIADVVLDDFLLEEEQKAEQGPLALLSPRERQILPLVAEGKTSVQIAEGLFLSPKTVDTYRSRLMEKLGVKDRTALIRLAIRHGLIETE